MIHCSSAHWSRVATVSGARSRSRRSASSTRATPGLLFPALPGALAPTVEQLAEVCRTAHGIRRRSSLAALEAIALPEPAELAGHMRAQMQRLADVPLSAVLEAYSRQTATIASTRPRS